MAWNVHTNLSNGDYEIIGRHPAPIYDPDTRIATLEADILFRGSRDQVVDEFAFGKTNAPNGGSGMFSLSPASIEMVPYTEDDPHWDVRGRWVGIHADFSTAEFAFNFTVSYTQRTTDFPMEIPVDGGAARVAPNPDGFAPDGNNPVTTKPYRCRRKDWLPVVNVLAVMRHTIPPHPTHQLVLQILTQLAGETISLIDFADYTKIPDPVWVTWRGFNAPASVFGNQWPQKSAWFPVITPVRRIPNSATGADLHIFNMTCTRE